LLTEATGGGTQIICSVWLAQSCWLWLEDRFEVDFEADFTGARLSAVVEGWFQVRPGPTGEGAAGGENGPVAVSAADGSCRVGETGLVMPRMACWPARSPRLPYRLVRPGPRTPSRRIGRARGDGVSLPGAAGRLAHVWSW